MPTRLVRRGSAAVRPAAALAVFGTLLAGCAPAERAVAPELQPGALQRDVAAAESPVVYITEVMANPDPAADEGGEWFEVFNAGTASVNLKGWRVRSGVTATPESFIVSAGADLIVPAGGYAVFARSDVAATNGGLPTVTYVFPGTVALNNSNTDWLQLQRPDPAAPATFVNVDSISWGDRSSGTAASGNVPTGASRVLPAAALTSNAAGRRYITGTGSLWVTSTASVVGTNGRGTPGTGDYVAGGGGGCATPGAITQVTLTPAAPSIVVNATQLFTASASDANGCAVTTTFTWTNSTPATATLNTGAVTATNTATALTAGQTTITASAGGLTATATLTVTSAPVGAFDAIALSNFRDSDNGPLPVGFQGQFGARATKNGATVGGVTFVWGTETPDLIDVNQQGLVTAKAAGSAIVTATANGITGRFTFTTVALEFAQGIDWGNPLEFGAPADNTPDDELRITRPQYISSYNVTRGQPNWVAYDLEGPHRGDAARCECFSADPLVPAASRILYTDYTGSGYSRGHMAMSEDRTPAALDNATTFYMTNIVPQMQSNNGGPWLKLETYLGDLAKNVDKEVYIVAGGAGYDAARTLNNAGKVWIPLYTWKVALIRDRNQGLAGVDDPSDVRVIAVKMPNTLSSMPFAAWESYQTTVDDIEALTGYDLLSLLPNPLEDIIESGDRAPTARITGAGVAGGAEGQTLAFDASTSSDPDAGDVLSYQWAVDGVTAGIGPSLSRTFADNGTYAVRLIVADKVGAADTTTTMVTIANVLPAVGTIAGASISEAGTYTTSGAFTDPGADGWTATVDYGDGTGVQPLSLTGKTFALSHTYADNGTFTVTVTVTETDAEAGVGTRTASVVVGNVAPVVNAFAGATILRGETYTTTGTFVDPGADSWTATVNYGDGAGEQPLALSGKSFALSHTYATAGRFTVTVTVNDDDAGTGARTATVTVETAGEGTSNLAAMVQALGADGTLERGEANSLAAKLRAAAQQIDKDAERAAGMNILQAFINEVEAMRQSGRLTEVKAMALIDYARRVIASA